MTLWDYTDMPSPWWPVGNFQLPSSFSLTQSLNCTWSHISFLLIARSQCLCCAEGHILYFRWKPCTSSLVRSTVVCCCFIFLVKCLRFQNKRFYIDDHLNSTQSLTGTCWISHLIYEWNLCFCAQDCVCVCVKTKLCCLCSTDNDRNLN